MAVHNQALIQSLLRWLGGTATLKRFDDADRAFHVRAAGGGSHPQTLQQMLDATAAWMREMGDVRAPPR